MKTKHLNMIAALMIASPLVADWQDCCDLPICYNASFIEDTQCGKFYAEIDYLIWYANEEGLSYASTINASQGPSSYTGPPARYIFDESDHYFKTCWDSGVKAVLGYKPASRSWDARATYTWFTTRLSSPDRENTFNYSLDGISGGYILSDYVSNIIHHQNEGTFDNVETYTNQSKWKLYFNEIDLDVGKEFYVAEDVTLRPYFGLRGLLTEQKLIETIGGPGTSNFFSVSPDILSFYARDRFDGIGAKAGLDAAFTLGFGVDLYGILSGSLIWGRHKIVQTLSRSTDIFSILGDEELHLNHNNTILNLDLGLGLRWNYWLNCGRQLLTFKFGWEQHIFTNMNQFQTMIGDPIDQASVIENNVNIVLDQNISRGDLSLSGFTVGFSYLF